MTKWIRLEQWLPSLYTPQKGTAGKEARGGAKILRSEREPFAADTLLRKNVVQIELRQAAIAHPPGKHQGNCCQGQLQRLGLSEITWADAQEKYLTLSAGGI